MVCLYWPFTLNIHLAMHLYSNHKILYRNDQRDIPLQWTIQILPI